MGGILFDIWNIIIPSMAHKILKETVFDKISAKLSFVYNIPYQGIGIHYMLTNTLSVRLIYILKFDFYGE